MFGVVTYVTINQVSTAQYPGRTKVFKFNFLNKAFGNSTWAHLTDTYDITLPRSIYFRDESTNKVTTWNNEAVYGNPDKQPLLMRGDKIKIDIGYSYFKPTQGTNFDRNSIVEKTINRFVGYIVKIKNDKLIELHCEDNMFALKQTLCINKQYNLVKGEYTLEKMLKEMLTNSTFPDVKNFIIKTDNYQHYFGKFTTQGVTMAQVLDELRKHYHLESFFYGNELRCGIIRYYPEDQIAHAFDFQKNIIEHNLDYQRADDMRIGIVAKSINKVELSTTNSNGKTKTKHTELSVTVGDKDGELRTLFFWGVDNTEELKKLAEKKLPFIKYEGFRGSFTTFSLPKVKHGDSVQLRNNIITEQTGTYLVKSVDDITTADGGSHQQITLDIRIDGLTTDQLTEFQKNGI